MSGPDLSEGRPAAPPPRIAARPRDLVQVMAFAGRAEALAAAIGQAFDLDLPGPGRWTGGPTVTATWLQPGGWLLEAEPDAPGAFQARVAAAVAPLAAVVDQSHGRSVIRLTGAASRTILASCCRLDLHPRVFGPDAAASTLVAHVPCVIRALGGDGFDLLVGSTYARWLVEDLFEASAAHRDGRLPGEDDTAAGRVDAPAAPPSGSIS